MFLFALLASAATANAGTRTLAPESLKVEPPSWWAGHSINPVRLLVRGRNLHGARVRSVRPEMEASGALVNTEGTYLFVDVRISQSAQPGDYPLAVETPAGKVLVPFKLETTLDPRANFQGITTDDVIYLVMPDRFSDGDTSNDAPRGSPRAANDRANPRAFHGGDLRGVINHLPYLKELGVTALWLTPWYDNWDGMFNCDKPWCPNTSYHGYGAIDYYGVENRFGDMATLRELVGRAHALGLKVIQDQVANHVSVHHPWLADPPLEDWFHGTPALHSKNPFRADLLLSPHASPLMRAPTLDGWFSDDLPDMNQDEPEVARYEIQNSLWWVGMTGIDGIRQDTIQYMPRPFIRDLNDALKRQYGRMWMVGEVFDRDAAQTSFFIGGHTGWDGVDTHLNAVFDFPSWQVSLDVFTSRRPVKDLRYVLRSDALYPDASRLVMMANNHDTPRFMSLAGATPEGAMMHTAYVLTTRGTPQLYYGEELAMSGGADPDNRRDFPGGFAGDARNAFEKRGRNATEQSMYEWTRDLLRLRREHPALRRGELIDLAFDDDSHVYARRDESETIVVVINRAAASKEITFPSGYLGVRESSLFKQLLPTKDGAGAIITGGLVKMAVPPRSVIIYQVFRTP
ncbi:MAG: alpha-amylase family glycosyl hydrolase [Pyrinomonadaceae bacterium]